ncbi:hypothetical protein SAMN05443661_1232 [Natronobacterium gregoryi]|uniref:Uncharacterized protein n=2 Tax=Natronobacterium gregoryi TaxID=44930 RepID=L0AKT5_NATGS|nr:hypothetical protein Natgr_2470 [Natronobacterium gregoryi SP2]SFJ33909.1 hypothetical protein SAMN05443661_1232 [Natronobacterium gregoryi]
MAIIPPNQTAVNPAIRFTRMFVNSDMMASS